MHGRKALFDLEQGQGVKNILFFEPAFSCNIDAGTDKG